VLKKLLTASILLNVVLTACLFALLNLLNPDFGPPASDFGKTNAVNDSESPREIESPRSTTAQAPQSAEIALRPGSKEQPILMPLVFQNVDLAQLNLNRDQLQAIEDLRHRFVDEIGGLEQDPTGPAYRDKWLRSQPEIDNDLRGMIGIAAFQDYQIEAADQAGESQQLGSAVQ
jgi:hypothetical protein